MRRQLQQDPDGNADVIRRENVDAGETNRARERRERDSVSEEAQEWCEFRPLGSVDELTVSRSPKPPVHPISAPPNSRLSENSEASGRGGTKVTARRSGSEA